MGRTYKTDQAGKAGPALDHLNDFPASRSSETLSYQKVGLHPLHTENNTHS